MNAQFIKVFSKKIHHHAKAPFWFIVGFSIAGLTIFSLFIIIFQNLYNTRTIPGIYIDNVYVGEKNHREITNIFDAKNKTIENSSFTLTYEDTYATLSAQQLNIGYNSELIAQQAVHLGKSPNIFANFFIIMNAYINGMTLNSSYTFDDTKFAEMIKPMETKAYLEPTDALFQIENNRVSTFKQSTNGRKLNVEKAKEYVVKRVPVIIKNEKVQAFTYEIPTIILEPKITTEEVNEFGIVEQIGVGKSYYQHSIPNRIHNVALAASRLNGILVHPDEEFSFAKYLGDVSKFTGYKEAYVIQSGKTVLGDGGGVCQVSSTLFRAILNSGLPITERHAHAYRVGYYEQYSPPGLDATVYVPSIDLKFKNDTGNHILIQSYVDPSELSLTFILYGKKDGREITVSDPVVTSVVPALPTVYQDDPSLPKGIERQVDYAAAGATVVFNRTVEKDGKIIINEKFTSRYRPWAAVFLRGTKEG